MNPDGAHRSRGIRDADLTAEIGRRLRARRLELGWSMASLSLRSGRVARMTIASYERGDRAAPVATLVHLADVLGVRLTDLVPELPLPDGLTSCTAGPDTAEETP